MSLQAQTKMPNGTKATVVDWLRHDHRTRNLWRRNLLGGTESEDQSYWTDDQRA